MYPAVEPLIKAHGVATATMETDHRAIEQRARGAPKRLDTSKTWGRPGGWSEGRRWGRTSRRARDPDVPREYRWGSRHPATFAPGLAGADAESVIAWNGVSVFLQILAAFAWVR